VGKKTKLGITREKFLKMRGGKLISIESGILGVMTFLVLAMKWGEEKLVAAIAVALIVGFAFPILVGSFKSLGWVSAVLFSLMWAILAFNIGKMIGSFFPGLLLGILFFAIVFFIHKHYAGLQFRTVSVKNDEQQVVPTSEPTYESVIFCSKCGRRIRAIDGRCEFCDK
jgi:hypothetical protein